MHRSIPWLWGLLPLLSLIHAEAPSSEADYYVAARGKTGLELKQALHGIIRHHTPSSYAALWEHLRRTDEDPENPEHVILLYTGWSVPKDQNGGRPSEWNREHLWPASHGLKGKTGPMNRDLHHIRPTDVSVNSRRGHLNFDDGGERYTDPDGPTENRVDEDSWEPRDAVKGDVARMLFYMVVRYEGMENGEVDLELHQQLENLRTPRLGKLETLLRWHQQDPVDAFERRRNERIYEIQGNRNPFIDHPGWVELIWERGPEGP